MKGVIPVKRFTAGLMAIGGWSYGNLNDTKVIET